MSSKSNKQKLTKKQREERIRAAQEREARDKAKREARDKLKRIGIIVVCVILVLALFLPTAIFSFIGQGA